MESLKTALALEVEAVRARLARYEALTKKIVNYQAGEGEAPSVADFLQWREDVELALAIKKLKQIQSDSDAAAAIL